MGKKVVVITGAGTGLGASLATKYSEMGFYVCLLGRTVDKLVAVAETLTNKHSIYKVDVSSNSEVRDVFAKIKRDVGPIDLLINNAGVGVFELAEDIDEEGVHDQIDINLKGTIFCTQAVLKDMKERNEGVIANVISTSGLEGTSTFSVYAASKFGVRGFTESLKLELESTNVNVFSAYMDGMKTAFWEDIHVEEGTDHMMDADDVADIMIANIKPRDQLKVTEVVIRV